jgi:predicted enzyme related to lactoylglutathione lyase/uncharacterized protein YciI
MPHPVTWFEISSPDHEKLRGFYAELFGWALTPLPEMEYALVDTGAALGGGITAVENDVVIYVEVPDLAAAVGRAEELGGRVVVPVTEIPDMVTFAQIADPAGNTVGLVLAADASGGNERPPSKFVVFYEPGEDTARLAPIHMAAHETWMEQLRADGDLLAIGTFADPLVDGAMTVLRSREAAQRFVEGDPFVTEGVVAGWHVKEWKEIYLR